MYGQEFQSFVFRGPGMSGSGFYYHGSGSNKSNTSGTYPSSGRAPEIPFSGLIGRLAKFALKRITGLELPQRGRDWADKLTIKPEAAREGTEVEYPYKKWGKSRNLLVKIPAGTKDGQQIRLSGAGGTGKSGGQSGDLYLTIRIKTPLLQRLKEFFSS
jgi:curved DNA-binding protein CbpA